MTSCHGKNKERGKEQFFLLRNIPETKADRYSLGNVRMYVCSYLQYMVPAKIHQNWLNDMACKYDTAHGLHCVCQNHYM